MPLSQSLGATPAVAPGVAPVLPTGTIVVLIAVITLAAGAAAAAAIAERNRREVLARLSGHARHGGPVRALDEQGADLLLGDATDAQTRIAAALAPWVPPMLLSDASALRLARAGYHDGGAAVLFAVARVLAPVFTVLLVTAAFGDSLSSTILLVAGVAGVVAPTAIVDRKAGARQARLASALPDALDLMVVCLEAGVGIDAALVRVAREIEQAHPVLSTELTNASRRIAAGLPRTEALNGLVVRTGLDEVRAIVSTILQAERLGTSLARVLRMHSEALRQRRRQLAEKRAAESSVKMMFPLVALLLPAFFIVVLGPAALTMMQQFGSQ